MNEKPTEAAMDIYERLRESGALLEGHFLLSSGLHSDRYIQCARLLSHPEHAEYVGRELVLRYRSELQEPVDVVVGPALGGVIVAHEVARALSVRALFAEREAGALTLRRGFALAKGERVLVVEDVITTGGSAAETGRLVESHGGRVVGYAAIVERGAEHGLSPLYALWQVRPQLYPADDCPLCKAGMPCVKPGSRSPKP
jgi:orotate phosphoribosyltransferase